MFQYLKTAQSILGMNARNFDYIRPNNNRRAIRLANNKLKTKHILQKVGIPVPKLYGVIANRTDLDHFSWETLPSSFVLKPNMGLGGGGIMVIYGRKKNSNWIKSSGGEATIADFKAHIQDILDGRYSISGDPDLASRNMGRARRGDRPTGELPVDHLHERQRRGLLLPAPPGKGKGHPGSQGDPDRHDRSGDGLGG